MPKKGDISVPSVVPVERETLNSTEALTALRARVAKIEGHTQTLSTGVSARAWTSGFAQLDTALGGCFGFGALHEIMAASPVDLPSASAFAFGMLARLPRYGPILWCTNRMTRTEYGAPYAPGLAAFGINPARIISVAVHHPRDLSFVLEEAARLPALAAIITEGPLPSFTASRRLALLLATSQVPMLFVADGKLAQGSAAATRFVVSPIAAQNTAQNSVQSAAYDLRAPGPPAFHVTLARTRGGRPGLQFETVFNHASLSFTALSRALSDSVPDRELSVGAAPKRQLSA